MLALLQVVVTLIAGLLLADFASGVIHWVIDRYTPGSTPVIGTHFVRFIHEHHERPHAMFQLLWVVNNAGFFILVGSLFGLCCAFGWLNPVTLSAFAFGACANQIHAWAHRRPRYLARIVRPLQRFGILQSPRHHGVHHGASPTEHYCLITDWVNPVVDRLDLWRRAEVGLSYLGLKPMAYARPNPNYVVPTATA
ncbi:fatty acid desaturase CarF family protein [Brevundimonas halotolerans]|uniref:Ubiquitin-conjugating enzyme E2 variant n=1 Tax=Brevundimonas halotolerans TaxID=69670 RepID=A0A7W9A5Q6_9CAUL|nr:fatty acid desaturase CarF family protein [Brevundimonas halotolerans]MBB5661710.1 ubiquitin-conjugating enzyme E2 variant [Brevundimonas halotolerans]